MASWRRWLLSKSSGDELVSLSQGAEERHFRLRERHMESLRDGEVLAVFMWLGEGEKVRKEAGKEVRALGMSS